MIGHQFGNKPIESLRVPSRAIWSSGSRSESLSKTKSKFKTCQVANVVAVVVVVFVAKPPIEHGKSKWVNPFEAICTLQLPGAQSRVVTCDNPSVNHLLIHDHHHHHDHFRLFERRRQIKSHANWSPGEQPGRKLRPATLSGSRPVVVQLSEISLLLLMSGRVSSGCHCSARMM